MFLRMTIFAVLFSLIGCGGQSSNFASASESGRHERAEPDGDPEEDDILPKGNDHNDCYGVAFEVNVRRPLEYTGVDLEFTVENSGAEDSPAVQGPTDYSTETVYLAVHWNGPGVYSFFANSAGLEGVGFNVDLSDFSCPSKNYRTFDVEMQPVAEEYCEYEPR